MLICRVLVHFCVFGVVQIMPFRHCKSFGVVGVATSLAVYGSCCLPVVLSLFLMNDMQLFCKGPKKENCECV